MTKPVFILDHDGTLTNSERESLHYNDIVLNYLSDVLGISKPEISGLIAEAKDKIKQNPADHGWVRNGLIVAPAVSDLFIYNRAATELVLSKLHPDIEQDQFLESFFINTSKRLATAGSFYRLDAKKFILELSKVGKVVVVTNSYPDTVNGKLASLLGKQIDLLKVVGNAKKYDVDLNWVGVVPTGPVKLPGFPRDVYLQRKTYYDTLSKLSNGNLARISICGDVAELDTLMMDYLGCKTALLNTATTSPWELSYYQIGEPRRFTSPDLMEVADWLIDKK